uniref:Neuronal pentraxin 1 n=1 Tax=Geospiza parvula TaxID=87175 RepID=A0A8C3MK45_GEOPR
MAAGPPGSRRRLLPLLLLLGPALGPALGQGLGQTRFICTSVPLDGDVCAASALGTGSAEELKGTVLQLRETVLQQKETIMNQKETIRELTAKLGRCESQSVLELPGEGKGRKGFSKNTMGDLSRPAAAETLSQLGQTLQSLKTRLENLEQFSRMNSSSQTNNLKDILQNKIDDLEKQVLSRVNSLEEGKISPRNESEERGKIESTLTSLHQRISDLEKGQKDNRPPDRFQLTFPLRTNYMYAKVKKSLPEMYAFSICMWIKSSASPGMGTPFSYAVPGQANELVLIEWGNNPMEILINDKVGPRAAGRALGWGGRGGGPPWVPPRPAARRWPSCPSPSTTASGTTSASPGPRGTACGKPTRTARRRATARTWPPTTPSSRRACWCWARSRTRWAAASTPRRLSWGSWPTSTCGTAS